MLRGTPRRECIDQIVEDLGCRNVSQLKRLVSDSASWKTTNLGLVRLLRLARWLTNLKIVNLEKHVLIYVKSLFLF